MTAVPALGPTAGSRSEILRPGSWKKAEIRLVEAADGDVVILKDWRGAPGWLRPLATRLFRHEERVYRDLDGVEGIPRLLAAGDRVLALERIPGRSIGRVASQGEAPEVAHRLERVVQGMHRAGVYHADLRKRDNILVTGDGRVGIVDFASAIRVGRLGLLGRCLRPILEMVDRYAVLKWKAILAPAEITPSERRLVRLLDLLRLRPLRR